MVFYYPARMYNIKYLVLQCKPFLYCIPEVSNEKKCNYICWKNHLILQNPQKVVQLINNQHILYLCFFFPVNICNGGRRLENQ